MCVSACFWDKWIGLNVCVKKEIKRIDNGDEKLAKRHIILIKILRLHRFSSPATLYVSGYVYVCATVSRY